MTDPSTQECRRNHWRIWTTTRDSVSCPICKWERDYEFAPEPDRLTQPALEMANDAIRYLAREAAEIPLRVAEESGLTAKLPVTQNAYTVLSLPRDTGVRLRVSHDRIQLAMPPSAPRLLCPSSARSAHLLMTGHCPQTLRISVMPPHRPRHRV